MVMHARKQPRLDDGYADKKDANPFKPSDYPSKTRYDYRRGSSNSDRRRDSPLYSSDRRRDSPANRDEGRRDTSPNYRDRRRDSSPSHHNSPRYRNKYSYSDRSKEKSDSTAPSHSSSERRPVSIGLYNRTNSNGQNCHTSVDKTNKADARTDAKSKEQKSEKPALRVCGDWSEHVSSSGMQYYYNNKTEVSQWEKPKEWNDSIANKQNSRLPDSGRTNAKSSNKVLEKPKANTGTVVSSVLSEKNLKRSLVEPVVGQYPHSGKPDKKYLIEKFQASQSQCTSTPQSSSGKSEGYGHRRDNYHGDHHSDNRRPRRDSGGSRGHGHVTPRKHNHDNEGMDISPCSSPGSSRRSSCAGTPQLHPASTPNAINTSAAAPLLASLPQLINNLGGDNQHITNMAIQTLQKLQEVVSRQIAQQTSPGNPPPQSPRHSDVATTISNTLSNHHSLHHGNTMKSPHAPPHPHHGPSHSVHVHPHHGASTNNQTSPSVPSLGMGHNVPVSAGSHPHMGFPGGGGGNSYPHHSSPSPHGVPIQSHYHPSSYSSSHLSQHQHHHYTGSSTPVVVTTTASTGGIYGKLSQHAANHELNPLTIKIDCRDMSRGMESPGSDHSQLSCRSPSSSTTSSQHAPVMSSSLAPPGGKLDMSMGASPGLKNYYNDRLISHVTGWQAELAEKQANKHWQESLGDNARLTGVGVELKKARSLVRINEIQCTLHEQRILFLSQQIHELESLKPPSFSLTQPFTSMS